MEKNKENKVSRRQFIRKTGLQVAGTTIALNVPTIITSHAAPDQQINIGLIGCGGRGTGAALDAVHASLFAPGAFQSMILKLKRS